MRDMTVERHMKPRPPLPSRSEEYIDIRGHLRVPVPSWFDRAPQREGWSPFWVNIDLRPDHNEGAVKVYSYRRIERKSAA